MTDNTKDNDDTELVLDEFEDWQYEDSMNAAMDFLTEHVLHQVIDFDFENEDDDYVPGTAIQTLFTEMATLLREVGYTTEELHALLAETEDFGTGQTLH